MAKIGIIGIGNMGGAILKGLLKEYKKEDIIFTIPRSKQKDVQVKIAYDSPISAPLKAGDQVGTIEVTIPDKGVKTFPLVVAQDVSQAWFFQRITNSIYYLLWGKHSS